MLSCSRDCSALICFAYSTTAASAADSDFASRLRRSSRIAAFSSSSSLVETGREPLAAARALRGEEMLEPERECVPSRIVFRRAMPLGRSGVAGAAEAAVVVGVVERDARAGGCERRLTLLVGGGLLRDAIAGVYGEVEGRVVKCVGGVMKKGGC